MSRRPKPKGPTRTRFSVETRVFRARDYFQRPFPLQIDRVVQKPEDFPPGLLRTREFWRITLVEKGHGMAHVGGHRTPLKVGSVLLVHPDDPTTYDVESASLTLINVLFLPELFTPLANAFDGEFPTLSFIHGKEAGDDMRRAHLFTTQNDRQIPRLFLDLLDEFHHRKPLGESLLKVRAAELLIRLGRLAHARLTRWKRGHVVADIDRLIEKHHSRNLTLVDFADTLGMDKSHLGRVYRRERGRTIFDSLHAYRLERARVLLRTTAWPIHQVAEAVGYGDPKYFARKFRLHFKRAPAACRGGGS